MEPNTLKEGAYEYLKRRILTGDLLPGQVISEREIMDILSLGRTPIREALLLLQNENLVQMYPRKQTLVKPLAMQDILDLFSLRKMLEPQVAVQYLHQMDLMTLYTHDTKLNSLVHQGKETELLTFYTEDIAFHEYIISCSHNAKLVGVCKPLFLEGLRIGMLGAKTSHSKGMEETYRQHHLILQAIVGETESLIRQACVEHLNAAQVIALETYHTFSY